MTLHKRFLLTNHYLYGCKMLRKNILDIILYTHTKEESMMSPEDFLELCGLAKKIKNIETKLTWSLAIYTFLDERIIDLEKNNIDPYDDHPF